MRDRAKARRISRALNYDYPSHSYPITAREAQRLGLQVRKLDDEVEANLREVNHIYAEMAHPKTTDRDPFNYHIEEVCNILESVGTQLFYRNVKDWHYRKEERRWVPMNDRSGWQSVVAENGTWTARRFFIR